MGKEQRAGMDVNTENTGQVAGRQVKMEPAGDGGGKKKRRRRIRGF